MSAVPSVPDRDVAPAIVPCDLKGIETVLAVQAHAIVADLSVLAVLVGPGFQHGLGFGFSQYYNVQGFALPVLRVTH